MPQLSPDTWVPSISTPGPNGEFPQDRCTDHIGTYALGKGSKGSARQGYKVIWDMPSWDQKDRIVNYYKTGAPIILKPGPLERA